MYELAVNDERHYTNSANVKYYKIGICDYGDELS